MFDSLNVNSRRVVVSLCKGDTATIGNQCIPALDELKRKLLAVLSENLDNLKNLSGQDLVEQVQSLLEDLDFDELITQLENFEENTEEQLTGFNICKVKASSFRGLAPTGKEWEYNFQGQSHLIYGPNGSGKSSLLGAICWCLTGHIFRDDCPPSKPEPVTAYPIGGGERIDRDDAQSLMDENGSSSPLTLYWVEIELDNGTHKVTLRRESHNGLSFKTNGMDLASIQNIREAGIDDLDCEMRVLMPARVSHMKFGKNPDLIHLLAEVTGYGSLETIAELSEAITSNSRRTATRCETNELTPKNQEINETITRIEVLADEQIETIPSYERIQATDRKLEEVVEFGHSMNELIDTTKAELASDLGLEIPDKESDEYKGWKEQSNNLPGQINGLLGELQKSLTEIFSNSIGLEVPSEEEIVVLEGKLNEFETKANREITERLEWALREQGDVAIGLKLQAAYHFEEESNKCPVCTQLLDNVPQIKKELEDLKEVSTKQHIKKELDDFWRYLTGELDKVISLNQRTLSSTSFADRINSDWNFFKDRHCKELLLPIAENNDNNIESIVEAIPEDSIEQFEIPETKLEEAQDDLDKFALEFNKAKSYVLLCKNIYSHKERVQEQIQEALIQKNEASTFKTILERAKTNNDLLTKLLDIRKETANLYRQKKKADELEKKIDSLRVIADDAETIKGLKAAVREDVKAIVNGELGEKTKAYYESLYDNEVLTYEQLTTGHAANPDIKDQVNLYLKAGNHQVPMAPYSNAGRMRALLLSFTFALLEKSSGSLGFIVLDDPALSLDDEHKARFVDKLVGPFVESGQVILGTHYERFFKVSEPIFCNKVKLAMVPRVIPSDQVEFEPGDLLDKVKDAIEKHSGAWEPYSGYLRKWVERVLATISGYCSDNFYDPQSVTNSMRNYEKKIDPKIATDNRRQILDAFRSNAVDRVLHPVHHDGEAVQKSEVVDAHKQLDECAKTVKEEIERFRGLYNHSLLARHIAEKERAKTIPSILKNEFINKEIHVVREAAAAHNEQGIEWDTNEAYSLSEYSIIQVCSVVISPLAECGQYALLGNVEVEPENGDIVAIEAPDSQKYLRRYWKNDDGSLTLEGANPTNPFEPVQISLGHCDLRRVVGVLYKEDEPSCGDAEWSLRGFADNWFDETFGIRVNGTSLEPIARNGQIVLVKKQDVKAELRNDMLACLSIEGIGDVIKRCHINDSQYILTSINPNDRENPIVTDIDSIHFAYELKGVLFEAGIGLMGD